MSNDEVARYAAVADVFVLPSLLEALPTVAVEALASGTPVIPFEQDQELSRRQDQKKKKTATSSAAISPPGRSPMSQPFWPAA